MAGAPVAADKLLRCLPALPTGRQALYASSVARGRREVEGGGGAGWLIRQETLAAVDPAIVRLGWAGVNGLATKTPSFAVIMRP